MALVSGQTTFSRPPFAELNTAPYVEFSTSSSSAEDSDDEYVYVSSLAEQIAHAMLEDEEELTVPSDFIPSKQEKMAVAPCQWESKEVGWPSLNSHTDKERPSAEKAELLSNGCQVSHYAATWRDHGPSEWDCFYTPSLQEASKQLSSYYTTQLAYGISKHSHMFQGWNSSRNASSKQKQAGFCEAWDSQSHTARSMVYNSATLTRKESIGTGVFLPKIVNSGPRYQRKAGSLLSKSAYATRNKC
eukprot:c14638_g1_i1 orf=423-1157(-)